ncbi:hypothetical protein [Halorussus salinisoli]|uniref:hypothetical protein n=1 Tax=Halorussus salinisoli TaxID=2558242 RepID=UPI0010C1D1F7|nr:hypothetical protein [Halorussus salinisoli]
MNWSSFLAFYVAVMLLFGSFATGIGALEYEVTAEGPIDHTPTEWNGFEDAEVTSYQYQDLSERDQRIVDRAIAGSRLVFRAPGDLPTNLDKGNFVVRRNGHRYLVRESLFFNYETKFAAASGTLGFAGLLVFRIALRHEHGW